MAKAAWNDLLANNPEPYLVVALLPSSSEEERISNAQSAIRLLVRLIRKLPIKGSFAVAVSRQSGQRKVVCAFGDSSDADLMAWITGATVATDRRDAPPVFTLDHNKEDELTRIAGLPPARRYPRTSWHERWEQ